MGLASESLKEFLIGAIVMGDLVAAFFFLRYWKVTGDRFFLFFVWSFVFGALSRIILAVSQSSEFEPLVYLIRLLSYLLILLAILDKNRATIRKTLFQRT